jgi:Cu/Zn superoxide dismutase
MTCVTATLSQPRPLSPLLYSTSCFSTTGTMLLLLLLLLGSSYGQHNGAVGPDTPPAQLRLPPAFKRALVEMVPGNFNVTGALLLLESTSGLFVTGFLLGLRPGRHAMHVHEFGHVGDKCAAAGGHFNPDNTAGHSHDGAAGPGQQVGRGDVGRQPHTSQGSAAVLSQHAGHSDQAAPAQQVNQSGTMAPASGGVAALLAQKAKCRCGMAAGRHGGQGAAPGQHAGHGGVAAPVPDAGCRCDGAVAGGHNSVGGAAPPGQHVGHSSVGVLVQQAGTVNIAVVLQPTAGNSSAAAPSQHSSHSSGAAASQPAGRTGETAPGKPAGPGRVAAAVQHAGNGGTPGRHAGDLGYVVTPASGPTLVYRYDEKLRLGGGGRYDVSGLTVIVHENVAGEPRAACGIIRCLNC